jgi:prepilin peptidase CpaA
MPPLYEFFAATAAEPRELALVVVVIAAAVIDWRTRRVPNALSIAGALVGVALAIAGTGSGPSFAASIGGGVLGLVMLLPLYALRTMGAGDVKLMAAVGAFVGLPHIAFAVLFTFMAGGLFALAAAAWQRALPRLAQNLRATVIASLTGAAPAAVPSIGRMPYALAICAGTFACLWLRQPFHA